jgi:ribosomal protection tetracycline resistance protein
LSKNIRNIALFAHVDAGKTSLTESFLYLSGKIRQKGQVDKGNTQTDTLQVEKQRGISVKSGVVNFEWQQTQINLIDTPGHVDFSSETERSIMAIDAAIVLLSAVEALQAQAENMIHLLRKHKKPFLVFINKIDRTGADIEAVINELESDLQIKTLLMQNALIADENAMSIKSLWNENQFANQTEIIEKIVAQDDYLFEKYLEGKALSFDEIDLILKQNILSQELIPVFLGSAKYAKGIEQLLDAIVEYLPAPTVNTTLSAIVFKTKHIKGEGKWSALRIFGGSIKARDTIYNASSGQEEKVKLIRNTDLQNQQILRAADAGEIVWVQGLQNAKPGDVLGNITSEKSVVQSEKPLLSVQITPDNPAEINALVEAMYLLNNEDPSLHFKYHKEEQELHIHIRGTIQQEIIQAELQERFNLTVHFTPPTVIYKETPSQSAEGYVRYWMPKPCWAIMRFKIEPGARGSGVQFSSIVSVNDIKKQYQNDVRKTIPTALQQGILGWQVDDIKITLIEGEDHEVHTKSNDFAIATPMGIMDGLQKAGMTLLEPILNYKIKIPEAFLGAVASELTQMRASISGPEIVQGTAKIWGTVPLATSLQFAVKLSALTSGKAKLNTSFSHYDTCDISLGKTRAYKGISPLDTAKYILKARKALS